jgi:hypothetical protein
MIRNELLIDGLLLDLDEQTQLLPSFQANDLTQPDKINSDYSPEFSVPFTARNHQALGQAAYGTSPLSRAYQKTEGVLRSSGVETMPRALVLVKGTEGSRYHLQLTGGNKRFIEALGTRTLRELDLSRFNHRWTLDEVAARLSEDYYQAQGWSYEAFDRGKPMTLDAVPFTECLPTLSARLLWQQILDETGFSASDWQSPVLDRLKLPATKGAEYSEEFRQARRLVASIGPGYEDGSGNPSQDRAMVLLEVPYTDVTRRSNYQAPTVPGVYTIPLPPARPAYVPDEPVYLDGSASTTVQITFSAIRIGKAAARLIAYVDGVQVLEGPEITVDNETPFVVSLQLNGLLVGKGQRLTFKARLRGVSNFAGDTKWGYRIFRDAFFIDRGVTLPPDKLELNVRPAVPPGGMVSPADFLPDISLLDFFKTLVQVGGLSLQTDPYEDRLLLAPAGRVVDNTAQALDWTAKRDQPSPEPGRARAQSFRFGSYAQRNFFKWAADETVTPGYGDGVLEVADAVLPKEYTLTTLPFAATEDSTRLPGLLVLQGYKLRESEDPFAAAAYDSQELTPRLVLHVSEPRPLTVRGRERPDAPAGGASPEQLAQYARELAEYERHYDVLAPVSYFASVTEPVELNAQRYLLPVCWRSLKAMLTETRYLTERYRLTAQDVATLDYTRPIWDSALGDYFALNGVSEFDPSRPTEVQLVRLHASHLAAPQAPGEASGKEFYEKEFYTQEHY